MSAILVSGLALGAVFEHEPAVRPIAGAIHRDLVVDVPAEQRGARFLLTLLAISNHRILLPPLPPAIIRDLALRLSRPAGRGRAGELLLLGAGKVHVPVLAPFL